MSKGLEFTVKLSPKARKRMDEIMEKVGIEDRADIVRGALQVYEFVVKSELSGVKFFAYKPDEPDPKLIKFLKEDGGDDAEDPSKKPA